MITKQPVVYIVANKPNGTIYTGATSNIIQRIYQHKTGVFDGFTKKYGCKILVFYELHYTMESAILREKQIKAVSRKDKIQLIHIMNPKWKDLYSEII